MSYGLTLTDYIEDFVDQATSWLHNEDTVSKAYAEDVYNSMVVSLTVIRTSILTERYDYY